MFGRESEVQVDLTLMFKNEDEEQNELLAFKLLDMLDVPMADRIINVANGELTEAGL